jgi:hypothetical protein
MQVHSARSGGNPRALRPNRSRQAVSGEIHTLHRLCQTRRRLLLLSQGHSATRPASGPKGSAAME